MCEHATVTDPSGIASQYLAAVESFVGFARTLGPDDWAVPVPCTPLWTARDVLSHVSGSPDDAAAGRMDGAPGEAWTAAQIERNRDFTVDELLSRWAEQAPGFADLVERIGEGRPPIDCHTHEHDLRHALNRPGNRSNDIVDRYGPLFASIDDAPCRVVLEIVDGPVVESGRSGAEQTVTLKDVTAFELFRSRLGRRSRAQVRCPTTRPAATTTSIPSSTAGSVRPVRRVRSTSSRSSGRRFERPLEVRDDVGGVLEPDRDAQQALGDTGGGLLLRRETRVGRRRWVTHDRLGAAE